MKISCIVPVYNEAKRVGPVLEVLVNHPGIDELIVVNDGSTDDTEFVLKKFEGIHLISYPLNKGKTYALKRGLERAKHEWVMTIDSDLIGLNAEAITELLEPIVQKKADMTMTLRKNSLLVFRYFSLDFVSGERVFRKDLIPNLSDLDRLPKFGFEVYLNRLLIEKRGRLSVVYWKSVITPRKSVKFGFFVGMVGDVKMFFQILAVLRWRGLIQQFLQMRQLSKSG